MAGTVTTNSDLYKPETGEAGAIWDPRIIDNFDILDSYVYAHNYATINLAVADAANKTILVKSAMTMTNNVALTVPANVKIVILLGGSITRVGTSTMLMNGIFVAGRYTVFNGFSIGNITFGLNAIEESFPEWWTTNTTPGTTDMTSAIQSAIESVKTSSIGGIVKLAFQSYAHTGLTLYQRVFLKGSDWWFSRNIPFNDAGWVESEYHGSFLVCTSTVNDAISFPSGAATRKIKITDLAIVGPGSGSTIGVNGSIDGGAEILSLNYDFLNNVLIGNFSKALITDNFVTNSLDKLIIKGCTVGWDMGPNVTCTDTSIGNIDIQQCGTAIIHGDASGFHFYGKCTIQANTVGIKWMKAQNCTYQGVWFEGNTDMFTSDIALTAATLTKTTFIGCRGAGASTWTFAATEQVTRIQFINCNIGNQSIDISGGGAFTDNVFIGGEIGTITGIGDVNISQGNWFLGTRSASASNQVNAFADHLNNLGTISANPTPDWLDGNVIELTFNANIEIQVPTNIPEGATVTFVITQSGSNTVDFHADYNANWTNTGVNGQENSVMFKMISKQLYQIGGERGWS